MSIEQNSETLNIESFMKSFESCHPSFMSLNYVKEDLLDNYNYILTDQAKIRLDKLYTYIYNGIPVLLEGETGTSKTLSSEIICKYIYEIKNQNNQNKKDDESYIKFNLSAEVKINDLMQKFMGNKNSLSGLEIVDGPFLKAFKKGIPLILDEINLASEEVLQCIEEALDSGEINMEISGIGNVNCKKKEGFCLIATQNPNSDNYMNKRQYLSKSFQSHFQIVKFPPFEIEELKEIAESLFKSFNNNEKGDENDQKFISDLISFHKEWTSKQERKNEIACFTIREIAATVKAYIDEGKKNSFKIIKTIYASRYPSDIKNELLKLLGSKESFKEEYNDYLKNGSGFKIPKEMNEFYENEILKEVLESSLFSLNKRRNIIIVGEYGIGKSHIAREIAKIFNLKKKKNENNFCHFICTEETKCSDLIGSQTPKQVKGKDIYMEWKDGFLTKAIENGDLVILDNLQEANSTITERLNGLLDIKYDEGKKKGNSHKFDVPENPLKNSIKIHQDFRIIGICDIQTINQMSPAFLNRFDIIVLENQLNNISEGGLTKLLNIIINKGKEQSESTKEILKDADDIFGDDDKENINKEEENNVNEILDIKTINYIGSKIYKQILDCNIKEKNENKKTFSFCDISRFCHSIKIFLMEKGNEFKDIPKEKIIDFIYELLFSEKDIKNIDNEIKKILLKLLNEKLKEKEQLNGVENKNFDFIFSGNESLENFLSIVYASFLIHLHLCIIGPPGVGKTTSAKFISEILQDKNNYKFFPFHRNTKVSELYGTMNLKNQKMEYYNGSFIESAQKGCIFIADEMNLSSIQTMKSIAPLLDPLLKKNILLPGMDKPIDINDDFFFIACQNDLDNLGRNCLPYMLQRKLRNLNYPKQTEEEIKEICRKKRKKKFGERKEFSESESELLGEFMKEYNETLEKYKLPLLKWSFRDIDKIIQRISEHLEENTSENYKNFKYYHFIYFYLLSPIPPNYFDKKYESKTLKDIIHSLFIKVFHLEEVSDVLLQNYFENPKRDLKNNYIMKGNIGIKFNNLEKIIEEEKIFEEEMPNYYNDLFKLKLISNGEPVLLMGPSSYKTHLAKYFIKEICLKNFNIINLNQKTTIEELLGGPYILPPYSYMFFYNLLKKITNYEENENSITEGLDNMKKIIEQEKSKGNKYIILNSLNDHALENLKKYNDNINQNKNKQENINNNNNDLPQLVFNMGSILLSILKDESLIFKDIHEVSTEIFERFNELFGSERILSLNEDIYGTLFKQKKDERAINKFIKLENNISIFATCPENSFHSLSESITSRFSVICIGEHGIKEKEKIILNYSKKCHIMNNEIFEKISKHFLKENFTNINKLKNMIDIFDEMNKNNVNNNQEIEKITNNLNYIMFYIKLNDKFHLYDEIAELNNRQSPLKNENNFLISKISKLKIYSPKIDEKDTDNIVFTPVFNEMADLLHFGICTGTPLILEGFPGQGKQKVINYISNLLNYDVENIIITNNFSVNDLFKKTVLESKDDGAFTIDIVDTKLNKILSNSHSIKEAKEEHINQKPVLFVFHNIHKARADVLSKISCIFNEKCINSKYFFIGLINLKESFIERKSYYYYPQYYL